MDKKVVGLVGGAISALALMGSGAGAAMAASPPQSLAASSFDDLLQPIPNAVSVLREADANGIADRPVGGELTLVQDHHHHHHHVMMRRHHHHHVVIMHRHHHHHHHNVVRRLLDH